MNKDFWGTTIGVITGILLVVFFWLGNREGITALREEAIQNNVAEWTINKTNGNRSFVWITNKLNE